MEPAIGASLPSLDDLPAGAVAQATASRHVFRRLPDGRLYPPPSLTRGVEGPYRLLAAGLSAEVLEALDDCETYEAEAVLAQALGDRRPQPEGSTALWAALYAQALGEEARYCNASAVAARLAAERATRGVVALRAAAGDPGWCGETASAARRALGEG